MIIKKKNAATKFNKKKEMREKHLVFQQLGSFVLHFFHGQTMDLLANLTRLVKIITTEWFNY